MSKVVPLEGFGGGGSSPLNFKIVAYATEEELAAAQPKENTIGVITTTPITSWIFSTKKPFDTGAYDGYIVENAGTVLGTINGRTYTKTNDGRAIFAFVSAGGFVGPMLVSPIQSNAGYTTSGNYNSVQTAPDTVTYNGTTYYYPSGAWMGGASLDGLTPSISASTNAEAALILAKIYEKFIAEEEEAQRNEGTVWFSVGTESTAEFNALKKNALQVYPRSAQQYIDGAWVDVTAKSYQNGAWVAWDNRFFLFTEGVGLGNGVEVDSPNWNMGLTVSANVMNVSKSKGDTSRVFFKPKFDLTNFKTLHMELQCGDRYNDGFYMFFGVGNDQPTNSGNGAFDAKTSGIYTVTRNVYSLDISAITGEKYIKIICPAVITNLYNAWLE